MLICLAFAPVTLTSPFDKIFAVDGVSILVMLPPAMLILPAFLTVLGMYL